MKAELLALSLGLASAILPDQDTIFFVYAVFEEEFDSPDACLNHPETGSLISYGAPYLAATHYEAMAVVGPNEPQLHPEGISLAEFSQPDGPGGIGFPDLPIKSTRCFQSTVLEARYSGQEGRGPLTYFSLGCNDEHTDSMFVLGYADLDSCRAGFQCAMNGECLTLLPPAILEHVEPGQCVFEEAAKKGGSHYDGLWKKYQKCGEDIVNNQIMETETYKYDPRKDYLTARSAVGVALGIFFAVVLVGGLLAQVVYTKIRNVQPKN